MYDRSDNADGDRISDYTTLGHFRRELHRYGIIILVYFVVCLKIWLGPFHLKVWGGGGGGGGGGGETEPK